MLSNTRIREIAVGSQEGCVFYTLMFPGTFLSISLCILSFSQDLLLSAPWAWLNGKKAALKMKFASEDKELSFNCLFLKKGI